MNSNEELSAIGVASPTPANPHHALRNSAPPPAGRPSAGRPSAEPKAFGSGKNVTVHSVGKARRAGTGRNFPVFKFRIERSGPPDCGIGPCQPRSGSRTGLRPVKHGFK